MRLFEVFVIFVIIIQKKNCAEKTKLLDRPVLNFTEIAAKYNYKIEEYEVITEDGYILRLFRIPGRLGIPILIMHGLTDTSDTWLLRGQSSLGITLAKFQYDLWFGNVRGNKYSRRHVTLDPDKDSTFWDFSFHEHGYYDLSVMIDTVLSKTGAPKVNAIGYSQGNAIFYVLGSSRPEYNEKVNLMIALAPICYLTHIPPPLSLLIKVAPEVNAVVEAFGINEVFGDVSISGKLEDILCNNIITGYPICWLGTIMPTTGFDLAQYGLKFYSLVTKYFPSSSTRKNFYHYAQVSRRRSFSRYDYGPEKNMKVYNSIMPPDYNMKKVTMPVILIAGKNDKIAVLSDVATLRKELPNVKNYILIKREEMNHIDFVWGRDMKDYLFPHIFEALGAN